MFLDVEFQVIFSTLRPKPLSYVLGKKPLSQWLKKKIKTDEIRRTKSIILFFKTLLPLEIKHACIDKMSITKPADCRLYIFHLIFVFFLGV